MVHYVVLPPCCPCVCRARRRRLPNVTGRGILSDIADCGLHFFLPSLPIDKMSPLLQIDEPLLPCMPAWLAPARFTLLVADLSVTAIQHELQPSKPNPFRFHHILVSFSLNDKQQLL